MTAADAPIPVGALMPVSGQAAARAMASALRPSEADALPPEWLLPEQHSTFRRTLAAVEMFGGALVAEPTGAGKTFIALAVAAAWSPRPPVCLVPASVAAQWRDAAARISIDIVVGTHERASRGSLPRHAGLVIVDESHRFRNPRTRRHAAVARWLVGRQAVLLTATPAVNRLADVVTQLRLVVRDDVLALWGTASLRHCAEAPSMPDALTHLIVRSSSGVPQPVRRYRTEQIRTTPGSIALIDRLALSRSPPVATLVRGVLLRAAASSGAALAGVLRRYRLLLLHAADAAGAGVRISRAALRGCIGAASEQTALWPLLASGAEEVELDLADAPALEEVERIARELSRHPDARVDRLIHLLEDGRRTLVFTGWRDTVSWLRDMLGRTSVAWCTGSEAGIGGTRLPRSDVLAMFGPRNRPSAPQVLITTDLASEGLDLQGAARVVHYDLPWTPMRLTQRDGRAARLGNACASVQIVRFDPPEDIDRRLRQIEILGRKGTLPARAGVTGPALDRWRAMLAAAAGSPGVRGIGLVGWEGRPGILACVSIRMAAGPGVPGEIVWLDDDGGEVRDPEWLACALRQCLESAGASSIEPDRLRAVQTRLATYLRGVLRRGATARWARPSVGPDIRKLARLLAGLARAAARDRDAARMSIVDRALRFTARGHTAGEELMVQELAGLSEVSLLARLGDLPGTRSLHPVDAAVVAAVLFQSRSAPLR